LKHSLLLLLLVTPPYCFADFLAGHHQLIVVTTPDWESKIGKLQLYERAGEGWDWTSIGTSLPVVVGARGLGWGIGLHPKAVHRLPVKREGDAKSPAGIFSIGTAFGFAPASEMSDLKIDYLPIDAETEAVDDPFSHHYNCIVSRKGSSIDWRTSEKMQEQPLYAMGLVINHNFPDREFGAGSAIFLHIWRNQHSGTVGCTAMSQRDLAALLFWLQKGKHPVLVQLPLFTYQEFEKEWNLPALTPKQRERQQADHLVDLTTVNPTIIFDIRYATNNNFLGFAVYPKPACYLDKEVAEALNKVQQELSLIQLGLKVFDGYRPLSVQQVMWDAVRDERYVSNPAKNKGRHTRGTAVDLTLVDCHGNELEMPTPFDDFTEKAHSDYPNVSEAAFNNRALLKKIMEKYHFQPLPTEWWHFDFEGWHDENRFPPLDVSFNDL